MSADFELAQRALAGDQDAFAELYRDSHRAVYRKLLDMLHGDADQAEDLTQETFTKAFRKLHLFRGEAKFKTWVYRIAFNEFLQYRRKRRSERETSIGSLDDYSSDLMAYVREQAGYRDLVLAGVEDRLAIDGYVDSLTECAKTAFVLRDLLEYDPREAEKLTGWSALALKSNLHRARRRMKALLSEKPKKIPLASDAVPAVFSDSCELEPKP